jgi:hypothetical protein
MTRSSPGGLSRTLQAAVKTWVAADHYSISDQPYVAY